MQQIQLAAQEKGLLLQENDALHLRVQELADEYQRLFAETKDYLALRQNPGLLGSSSSDSLAQGQQRLLLRIEELEDLVVELKHQ